MFLEVAEITVTDPARFEAAVAKARPHFLAAEGCHGVTLHRIVETPDTYRLVVRWRTVEDHIVTFRQSEAFQAWRALAGPFFASPPKVTHSSEVSLA